MKLRSKSLAFLPVLLLGTAAFLGGCATTGMDRSVKTSNSIQEVDSEIREMIVQIDTTGASFDSLVRTGQPDPKKALHTYSDDLAKLDRQGKRVIKRMDEMESRSTEYFAEWEKQGDAYKNPRIQELSAQRRTKLAELYAQVPKSGAGIKRAFHNYLSNLQEIQKYLSTDLTPAGLAAIAPVAEKSVQDRDALRASFQPVLSALDEIKAELYSAQ